MTVEKKNKKMQSLARKWQEGTISEQERAEFNNWYNSFDDSYLELSEEETPDMLSKRIFSNIQIHENINIHQKTRFPLYFRILAAAAVLLFFSAGFYFFIKNPAKELIARNSQKNVHQDVLPGKNTAVLTLANGVKISLNDTKKGQLIKQAGITVTKAGNGKIVYTVSKNSADGSELTFNTLETPKGGQFQINLADGTKVWLNAASLLKFPTTFTAKERNVTLEGEAYFEVAHNDNKPFNVTAAGTQVHVLGTHFNINAYKDEEVVKTTLIKGSVRLTYEHASTLLKPGQQGHLNENGTGFNVTAADTSFVTAWKNELFEFDNTDLHSLMRQLSRWYNIDVVYEGQVPNDVFFGKIGRKSNLSKVLKILELGDVHFKIDDRKLIVMP